MKKIVRLTERDLTKLVKRIIKENEENNEDDSYELKGELHRLVGKMMKLEKRMEMRGNPEHFVEEFEEAEREVVKFIRKNPSVEKYYDEIEDYFFRKLYQDER